MSDAAVLKITREGLFDAMSALLAAAQAAVEADDGMDSSVPAFIWQREDGVSIVMEQTGINEMYFRIQVPADDILSWRKRHQEG